jgi:hypothetical protein
MAREWMNRPLRLICIVLFSVGGVTSAQDSQELAPAARGLELSLGFGYGKGVGPVGAGVPTVQRLGDGGGTATLDFGWRLDPRWMLGAYGEFGVAAGNVGEIADSAKIAAAGIQGQFHMMPERRYDPWIGLGFGWRGYWADTDGGTYGLQGLDLARLRLGVDYRLSPGVAMGPVFGVTVTQFLSAKPSGSPGYSDVNDRKINTFFFGGLAGRFSL